MIRTAELSSVANSAQHWEVLASLGNDDTGLPSSSLRVRSVTTNAVATDAHSTEESFGELIDLTLEPSGRSNCLLSVSVSVIFDSGGERLAQQDVVLGRDVVVDALPAPRSNRASVGVD